MKSRSNYAEKWSMSVFSALWQCKSKMVFRYFVLDYLGNTHFFTDFHIWINMLFTFETFTNCVCSCHFCRWYLTFYWDVLLPLIQPHYPINITICPQILPNYAAASEHQACPSDIYYVSLTYHFGFCQSGHRVVLFCNTYWFLCTSPGVLPPSQPVRLARRMKPVTF